MITVYCSFDGQSPALDMWMLEDSGVAKGGAGGANAPPQIFVVPLLQKKHST